MKQRVAVRAIIRQDQKTLLLRRANGRASILGKYELPGGTVEYKEQPDDAMRRYIKDDLGSEVQTIQLSDVLTYIDSDHRNIQYVLIVYMVTVSSTNNIKTNGNYNKLAWKRMSDVQQLPLTDSSKLLLGISYNYGKTTEAKHKLDNIGIKTTTDNTAAIIYSDGGSRGNPGPSAAGYVVMNTNEEIIDEGGVYLGITTNNQAEYHGVRIGLEQALELGIRKIDFRIDSMLVVNQMNGIYKIKNRELWPINDRIKQLVDKFDKVTFKHVKREFNQLADSRVNKVLDSHRDAVR